MYKFVLGFSLASLLFVPKWTQRKAEYLWCIDGKEYRAIEMAMGQLGIYIIVIALTLIALALIAIIKAILAPKDPLYIYRSRAPSEARGAE